MCVCVCVWWSRRSRSKFYVHGGHPQRKYDVLVRRRQLRSDDALRRGGIGEVGVTVDHIVARLLRHCCQLIELPAPSTVVLGGTAVLHVLRLDCTRRCCRGAQRVHLDRRSRAAQSVSMTRRLNNLHADLASCLPASQVLKSGTARAAVHVITCYYSGRAGSVA